MEEDWQHLIDQATGLGNKAHNFLRQRDEARAKGPQYTAEATHAGSMARQVIQRMMRSIKDIEQVANGAIYSEADKARMQSEIAELKRMQKSAQDMMKARQLSSSAKSSAQVTPEETFETRLRTDQELLQMQYDGLARQDQQLDRIDRSVTVVRDQAGAIHDEVADQNQLVESLHYDLDNVEGRLGGVQRRLLEVQRKMNPTMWYCLLFFVPFLLVLMLCSFLKKALD